MKINKTYKATTSIYIDLELKMKFDADEKMSLSEFVNDKLRERYKPKEPDTESKPVLDPQVQHSPYEQDTMNSGV